MREWVTPEPSEVQVRDNQLDRCDITYIVATLPH